MKSNTHLNSILTFIALSFIFLATVFYGFCHGEIPDTTNGLDSLKFLPMMWTPALASYVTAKIFKEPYLSSSEILGSFNRWILFSLLTPPLLALLTGLISVFLCPTVVFNTYFTGAIEMNDQLPISVKADMLNQMMSRPFTTMFTNIFQNLGAAWSFGTLFALGEEIGWRGYLYKKLEHLGVLKASLIIGPIWGLWHAPVILKGYNYPSNPIMGVPMMMLACTAVTPIMLLFREKAKSVWSSAIFHGSFNCCIFLCFVPVHGLATTFILGTFGLSGIISSIIGYLVFQHLISKKLLV